MDVSEAWRADHPWAVVYRRMSQSRLVAGPVAKVGFGASLGDLERPLELLAGLPAGAAVLDAPCGPGVALGGLRPGQDVRYVAGDLNPAMLARTRAEAQRRGLEEQVEVREADLLGLPFADGEFDLVLTLLGLHCVPDPARMVAELGRVLKPGGTFAGTFFATDAGVRYLGVRLAGRAIGVLGPSGGVADLRRWMDAAGLEPREVVRMGTLVRFTATRR